MMLSLILALLSLTPTNSFADTDSLNAFFSATSGAWGGRGTVDMKVGRPGRYEIDVDRDTEVNGTSGGQWNVTTSLSGMPGPASSTLTGFEISGSDLKVYSTNYTSVATIKASTATSLAFSTRHFDNGSGRNVINNQTLTILPNGTLHVISDIYQDTTLVEHFDYTLGKGR